MVSTADTAFCMLVHIAAWLIGLICDYASVAAEPIHLYHNAELQSMVALKDFMLLLILFIFIFMVLGIQLLGGSTYYTPANTATWRKGFSSFYESFYTVNTADKESIPTLPLPPSPCIPSWVFMLCCNELTILPGTRA